MQHECLLGLNGGSSHSFMSGECILCKQSVDKSIQKRGGFKLVTLTCPIIFCIYFRWWIAAIIILLVHVLIFVLFFKKHFLSPLLCYYFCYYGLAILMSLITEDASLYHFVFTLHAPRGMLSLLVIPLFLVIQFFVIKAVDAIYH